MTSAEIYTQVREIIADVLDKPDLQLSSDTTAEEVEGWDSFNHINIVVAVEAHFGIKINTAEIEELRNVGELINLVEKKLQKRNPS